MLPAFFVKDKRRYIDSNLANWVIAYGAHGYSLKCAHSLQNTSDYAGKKMLSQRQFL